MKFSIVIPALNEEGVISQAITALLNQNYPRDQFEIIVVDNGSSDNTYNSAVSAGADKVVIEYIKGTNIARQRGVDESLGDIIAFLDADCIPPIDWLRRIETKMVNENLAAISGPYDYNFGGITSIIEKIYLGFVFKYAGDVLSLVFRKPAAVMLGGNFAATREAINKIGGLPPLRFYGDDTAIAILIRIHAGRVKWDNGVWVRSSPRRFERDGRLFTTLRYIFYFFKVYIGGPDKLRGTAIRLKMEPESVKS